MEKALYITKNKLIYRIQPDFKEVEFMKDSNDEVYTILEGDKLYLFTLTEKLLLVRRPVKSDH
ncbi:MAG: hypothetical protein IPF52_03435 [Saprospiraceae bacterium]|nr:hypothetical protein [Saprospiraceae bacterium]